MDINTKAKRVAYAVSMYDTNIPADKLKYFIIALKKYDNISVWESAIQYFLIKQTGVGVERVLDPILLLPEREYVRLAESTIYKHNICLKMRD